MAKTREQNLFGAAVLKMSFRLRDALESPAFRGIYPGVIRDLGLTDEEVEAYTQTHRARVERTAQGEQE